MNAENLKFLILNLGSICLRSRNSSEKWHMSKHVDFFRLLKILYSLLKMIERWKSEFLTNSMHLYLSILFYESLSFFNFYIISSDRFLCLFSYFRYGIVKLNLNGIIRCITTIVFSKIGSWALAHFLTNCSQAIRLFHQFNNTQPYYIITRSQHTFVFIINFDFASII